MKINNSKISKIKFNGYFIKLVKINSNIVYQDEISMSLSNKTITITGDGTYDIYYADNNGVIANYDKICRLSNSSYDHLNELNIAPNSATNIVACNAGTTNIVASIVLDDSIKDNIIENKLYSVGILSDIHIDNDGTDEGLSQNDFQNALTFFKNSNADFVGIAGDITNSYGDATDYSAYNSIVNNNSDIPIKVCAGNHDVQTNYESYLGISKNYVYEHQGDIYIFLSLNDWNYNNPLTNEQITWLSNTLKQNKNNRVFLFFHFYIDPVGNVNSIYQKNLCISDTEGTTGYEFRQLMSEYKDNIIMFSGHSHLKLELQELGLDANIRGKNNNCCTLVHISSCARPRDKNRNDIYGGSQGCLMDVYESKVILKGIDFVKNKYLPIATYKIDFKVDQISDTNLLDLDEKNWTWLSNEGEASATYNSVDNTISITYDGTSSFGLNIAQPNLTLNAGNTYILSCNNIGSSTYISINNDATMGLNSSTNSRTFTLDTNIVNPTIVIWCDKNKAIYNNTIFNINLEII